jgi:hypothetical protein
MEADSRDDFTMEADLKWRWVWPSCWGWIVLFRMNETCSYSVSSLFKKGRSSMVQYHGYYSVQHYTCTSNRAYSIACMLGSL